MVKVFLFISNFVYYYLSVCQGDLQRQFLMISDYLKSLH